MDTRTGLASCIAVCEPGRDYRASIVGGELEEPITRYAELSRERLHREAGKYRRAISPTALGATRDLLALLPKDIVALADHLDMRDPAKALSQSMAITNAAIGALTRKDLSPLHLGGIACALVERELWELPSEQGGMITNVALSRLHGVYFTPANVAWYIAVRTLGPIFDAALKDGGLAAIQNASRLRVLDPACGAGIFLMAALELFLDFYDRATAVSPALAYAFGNRAQYAHQVVTCQLFGADVSPRLVGISCRVLAIAARVPESQVKGILCGDSLATHGFPCKAHLAAREGSWRTRKPIIWNAIPLRDGADIVLLNPPFGRLRVLDSDFREKSRALRVTEKSRRDLYNQRRQRVELLSDAFRAQPEYAPAMGGILDWQRLFLVRAINLLRASGRLGAIVPVSLLNDRSASRLRAFLFGQTAIERVDRLLETAKLFPGVNQPTCILVLEKGGQTRRFVTSRPVGSVPATRRVEFSVEIEAIRRLSPNELSVPGTDYRGWRLAERLHSNPTLGQRNEIQNLRGELDLTIFRSYIGKGKTHLVRGDHVERFRIRKPSESTKDGFVDKTGFLRALGASSKALHIARPRLVGRQCAFLEKQRRLSFTIAPRGVVVANSCNYLLWDGDNEIEGLLFLGGLLSSLVAEWRVRLTSSNNHINNYELDALPIPPSGHADVARAARKLSLYYASRPFGDSANGEGLLENELDCAVFRAYGLSNGEVEHLVSETAPARLSTLLVMYKNHLA